MTMRWAGEERIMARREAELEFIGFRHINHALVQEFSDRTAYAIKAHRHSDGYRGIVIEYI